MVLSSAEALMVVINDILDFSKIEAGHVVFDPVPFRLRGSLAELTRVLSLRAAAKHLKFKVDVSPAVPDALVGDFQRLGQVLVNLIGNAIKFTEKGEIGVRVSLQSQTTGKALVRFAVADTGVGIEPSRVKAIFEPFTQADSSTTRRFGGTGLGLTISARMVVMMGGRISVASEPGEGSTFSFAAPFELDPAQVQPPLLPGGADRSLAEVANPAAPAVVRIRSSLRVLVAEDSSVNQLLAVGILKTRGHSAVVAINGKVAVERFEEGGFDVILMDVQMPEMSGLEATAAIRTLEKHRGGHVPIVGVTAHAMKGDRERCLAAGMDAYVTKPIRPGELFAAIDGLVGKAAEPGAAGVAHWNGDGVAAGAAADGIGAAQTVAGKETVTALDSAAVAERAEVLRHLCGDDRALARQIVQVFVETTPRLIEEICGAATGHRSKQLARAAHKFRGAAMNFGPSEAVQLCAELERLGEEGDAAAAAVLSHQVAPSVAKLLAELRAATDPAGADPTQEVGS
jgi:CheY-like chemotaxis protein